MAKTLPKLLTTEDWVIAGKKNFYGDFEVPELFA